MSYRITGLDPAPFQHLFGASDAELTAEGAIRVPIEAFPGVPCRIEMRDLEPGETALLLNYEHLPLASPYRARHAIFVREEAEAAYDAVGVVPEVMSRRLIALRAYDAAGMMLDADLAEGAGIEPLILRLLANPDAAFLHAHNAKRGCYSGRIDRV